MYIHKCGRQFLLHPTPALPHSSSTTIVCSCILISIVAHCAMLLPLLLLPATCAFAAGNCSRGASKQQQAARQRESETDAGVDVAARYCCVILFFFWLLVWPNFIFTLALTHTHRHSRTLTQGHTHTYLYSTHWKCAHHVVIAHEILFIYVYILLLVFFCFILHSHFVIAVLIVVSASFAVRLAAASSSPSLLLFLARTLRSLFYPLCVCLWDACSCSLPSLYDVWLSLWAALANLFGFTYFCLFLLLFYFFYVVSTN